MTCSYLSVFVRGGIPIVLDGSDHTRASLTPILMHNMLNLISILCTTMHYYALLCTTMHNMLNLNWIKRNLKKRLCKWNEESSIMFHCSTENNFILVKWNIFQEVAFPAF